MSGLGLEFKATYKLNIKADKAKILGREPDSNPALTYTKYGKGGIYFLTVPMETMLSKTPGCFHEGGAQPYWELYSFMVVVKVL